MTLPQVIITVLAVAFLAATLVWALTAGRRVHWPRGTSRAVRTRYGRTVRVFVSSPISPDRLDALADYVAAAADIVVREWNRLRPRQGDVTEFGIWYQDDAQFEADANWHEWLKLQDAYLSQARRAIGGGPPLIITRRRHIETTEQRGAPVIHELLHVLLGETGRPWMDRHHEDPTIWEKAAAERGLTDLSRTVEWVAHREYQSWLLSSRA